MAKWLDANQIDNGQTLRADVCIVGGGAAGITLSRYLKDSGLDIIVLESGSLDMEGPTQALYSGRQAGLQYSDLASCRLRYLGGTSNHWAGYCRMHEPVDFKGRPELGIGAWPIGHGDLLPFVQQAARDLGFDFQGFDLAYQLKRYKVDPASVPDRLSQELETRIFQITTRKKQAEVWREELNRHPSLRLIKHANVTRVAMHPDGQRAVSVDVRTLQQRTFSVEARWFILAAHAMENARLLLASDDVVNTGIGNQHDQVGRYFMDHPLVTSGRFYPSPRFQQIYDTDFTKTDNLNFALSLRQDVLRREGILGYFTRFHAVEEIEPIFNAHMQLKNGFWKPADKSVLHAIGTLVGDVPTTLKYAASKINAYRPKVVSYDVINRIEQFPNPDSRVKLDSARDVLGMRKIVLDWRFTEHDYKTYKVGRDIVIKEMTRLGLGTFKVPEMTPAFVRGNLLGKYHHIGTTRMSRDPRQGVVNTDLGVHGTDNLFVCSSAVFPTAGSGLPTMILMGLSIRLAQHLKTLGRAA
jgi:choline dehydrogenase-like flavoprotein